MRIPRALAAALVLLPVLAACGSDEEAPSSGASEAPAAAFPVSIQHKYGTSEIKAAPQRVVSIGLVEQDALLALGVVPLATTEWFGEQPGAVFPWAKDKLGGATPQVLSNVDGIQFEKIAALKPDLIVGMYSDLSQQDYTTLSRLAPVLAPPAGTPNFGVSWQDVTRTVGKAVGKATEADTMVKDVEATIAKVSVDNPQFKGKSAVMATIYEGYFVYGPEDSRGRLLTGMGFTLPAGLKDVVGDEFGKNLSRERTDLLDTDVVIWLVEDYAKGNATLDADPVYAKLKVHTQGREVVIEDGEELGSAASFISVLSLPYLMKGLAPQIAAAIDGNPATTVARAS